MTAESNAVVAELAYAHDSGSCEHNARAGSSPANCTKRTLNESRSFLLYKKVFWSYENVR